MDQAWRGAQLVWFAAVACIGIVHGLQDRSGAFIGYSEAAGYGHCQDKVPSCEQDASVNKCLTDPYNMRRLCPFSCGVEPCVNPGTYLKKYVFKGHATRKGTELYKNSLAGSVGVNHFNTVSWGLENIKEANSPSVQLQLSSLGLGTYLGAADDATDEQVLSALMYGATRGWNVIDTASSYRDGRAEATIGQALSLVLVGNSAEQFPADRAEVTRDVLFIASKAGFLNTELKQQLLSQGAATSADIMGGSHCLTRACLRASVAASLAKMRIDTLDLLYLHNAAEVQLLARGKAAFLEVLRSAFTELEALRQEGKIRGYGMATWDCFRQPPIGPLHLDLEEIVDLAKEVGGQHHGFMAIQLPINIKMTEAFSQPWQQMVNKQKTEDAAVAAATRASAEAAAAAVAAAAAQQQAGEGSIEGEAAVDGTATAPAPPPPPPPPAIVYDSVTLIEAAQKLNVAVFASAPLGEAQLLQSLTGPLDSIIGLNEARTTAKKLVQYTRSVPGVTSVLVGHKAQEHVEANVALATKPKLAEKMWEMVKTQVADALQQQEARSKTAAVT